MKHISEILKTELKQGEDYAKNQKSRRNAIYKDILKSNLDINAHLIEFLDDPIDKIVFIEENNKCLHCQNADDCQSNTPYYQPTIQQNESGYGLEYNLCNKQRGKRDGYIDIKQCEDYYNNANRTPILKELLKGKGGYIWGTGGHGKTFTLGYVANVLNKQGKSTYFNLGAKIQNEIMNFETRNEMFNKLERFDILLVDDFGGERWTKNTILSCWVPLIKSRIDNNKPIYFSSNYSLKAIMKSIAVEVDETTANIIFDRIMLQPVLEFKDKNYRK